MGGGIIMVAGIEKQHYSTQLFALGTLSPIPFIDLAAGMRSSEIKACIRFNGNVLISDNL
jgi:hypothetical protein